MKHSLPELPYSNDALAPFISAETISYHYGKHHQAYVDKLNDLIKETEFESMPLEQIIMKSDGAIFNNAAQVWNHTFYWKSLTPKGTSQNLGKLGEAINKKWGSLDQFKTEFGQKALGQFGSGWAWLIQTKAGALEIVTTGNAATPLRDGHKPIFTLDVWEHAYYIDFRNARAKYIESFWNHVNWDFANKNFA